MSSSQSKFRRPRPEWPGRWKFYGVKNMGVSYFQGIDDPPEDTWVVPVDDEARERARVALNETHSDLFQQAREGKPHAEEEIVRIVIEGLKG